METVKHALEKVTKPIAGKIGHGHGHGLVFVTAGNGVIGYRVATQLLKSGYEFGVRVGYRDPLNKEHHNEAKKDTGEAEMSAIDKLKEAGATAVDFCWEKPDTYEDALEGVKTVFCSAPTHKGWDENFPAFIKACKHAGVRHIVKLSFYHAMMGPDAPMADFAHAQSPGDIFLKVPLVRMHRECDKAVMKCGLDYCILFTTHFMSNPLRYQGKHLREEGKFYGASGLKGVNYVSPNDIAEVVIQIINHHKKYHHQAYTLTGPKAITDAEVADLLTKAFDRKIEYVNQSAKEFHDTNFAALELVKASGEEEKSGVVTHSIEKICEHEAQTYEGYLEAKDSMTPRELEAFPSA